MRILTILLILTVQLNAQSPFEVRIGNINSERASVAEILLQPFLTTKSSLAYSANIWSFEFSYSAGKIKSIPISCSGAAFNKDIISAIQQLKPGNKIYIDNVKVAGGSVCPRIVNSICLVIR